MGERVFIPFVFKRKRVLRLPAAASTKKTKKRARTQNKKHHKKHQSNNKIDNNNNAYNTKAVKTTTNATTTPTTKKASKTTTKATTTRTHAKPARTGRYQTGLGAELEIARVWRVLIKAKSTLKKKSNNPTLKDRFHTHFRLAYATTHAAESFSHSGIGREKRRINK